MFYKIFIFDIGKLLVPLLSLLTSLSVHCYEIIAGCSVYLNVILLQW